MIPHFSIIIPAHNKAYELEKLLKSIKASNFQDFEIIVVDDVSSKSLKSTVKKYKTTYIRLKEKKGTGGARNVGAKKAKGKILVFMDSDTVLFENALTELAKSFRDKKVKAVTGVYDKKPASPSFFTNYKALRDYSYIMFERDPRYPIGGFGGWISAIRKMAFKRVGGFDESYKGAGMEDYEYGWRLIEKGVEIKFNPKVKIMHHFDEFWTTVKKFYKRSYLWTELFLKHKRFFSSATNPKEALIAGLANLSTLLLLLALFCPPLWLAFLLIFFARLYLGRKFLIFVAKERGIIFSLATLPVSHTLYLAVYLGAAAAFLKRWSVFLQKLLCLINNNRTENIANLVLPFIEKEERVLDLGAGDGKIAEYIKKKKGKVDINLLDVTDRHNETNLKMHVYEGGKIPFKDDFFDSVLIIFVLHHASKPLKTLKDAARVSKRKIIIVGDIADNWLEMLLTKAWDIIVNSIIGRNWGKLEFRSDKEWKMAFKDLDLKIVLEKEFRLPFYRPTKQKLYVLKKT